MDKLSVKRLISSQQIDNVNGVDKSENIERADCDRISTETKKSTR